MLTKLELVLENKIHFYIYLKKEITQKIIVPLSVVTLSMVAVTYSQPWSGHIKWNVPEETYKQKNRKF